MDIVNIASANAIDPLGQVANEDNDNNESTANDPSDNTAVTVITQSPSLSMVKTADKTSNVSVGEIITYTYDVNNTGNITIDNINVTDVHSGTGTLSDMNQTDIMLIPGQSTRFTTTYVVTQEDVDAGNDITNTATVDGDARGGAALSVRNIVGKPIKFMGVGEKMDALEPFHPDRIASSILGMGDVLSLVEEIERKVDKTQADKLANKVKQGQRFTLIDFREQLSQMQNYVRKNISGESRHYNRIKQRDWQRNSQCFSS